jgi:SAM-dependent methyltransferase
VEHNSNFAAAREFVDFGSREHAFGRRQSISGPGSSRSAAKTVLALLGSTVREYGVTSILDLGCGDWNWMQYSCWRADPRVRYEGWEAQDSLVERLAKRFGNERVRFRLADLTSKSLPYADLVVCRDVLFHLRIKLAERLIKFLQENGCLFITTCFLDETCNTDIQPYLPINGWGFYRINLDIAPFNLQPYLIRAVPEPECSHQGYQRSVCLYRLAPPSLAER